MITSISDAVRYYKQKLPGQTLLRNYKLFIKKGPGSDPVKIQSDGGTYEIRFWYGQ